MMSIIIISGHLIKKSFLKYQNLDLKYSLSHFIIIYLLNVA